MRRCCYMSRRVTSGREKGVRTVQLEKEKRNMQNNSPLPYLFKNMFKLTIRDFRDFEMSEIKQNKKKTFI